MMGDSVGNELLGITKQGKGLDESAKKSADKKSGVFSKRQRQILEYMEKGVSSFTHMKRMYLIAENILFLTFSVT